MTFIEAERRDAKEAGFKHGIKTAAKLIRDSGNPGHEELAARVENLKLVHKSKKGAA